MKRPDFIARQSGRPTGALGRMIAWIMARETAALNERAIELLALQPSDRVLEIGFGHGRTIERMLTHVPSGRVAGIDASDSMTKLANRRVRTAVADGRADLRTGDAAALPFDAAAFDKALSVHTMYFWKDPSSCFRELRRVLRPGGTLVLGFTPKGSARTASFPADIYTFYSDDEVRAMLDATAFGSVEVETLGGLALARAVAV